MIVVTKRDHHLLAADQQIVGADVPPPVACDLIRHRPVLADGARADLEEEIARGVQRDAVDALERHRNLARVGAGRDEEVVLELAVAP